MARNPFYVEPGNDFGGSLAGLGNILAQTRQAKQAQQEEAQKKQRLLAAGQAAKAAYDSGDPSAMAKAMLEYPEISEQMNQAYKFRSEATRENMLGGMRRILAGEDPNRVFEERIRMVHDAGGDPTDTIQEWQRFRENPEASLNSIRMAYAATDPKGYEALVNAQGGAGGGTTNIKDFEYYQQLLSEDPARARQFAYQAGIEQRPGNGAGAPKPTSSMLEFDRWAAMPEGPEKDAYGRLIGINPETKAPAGYRVTADGNLEPIPGGPADLKMREQAEKSRARVQQQFRQIDSVMGNVDRAISQVGPMTAGLGGALVGRIPGSVARDLEATIDTIKANLGFDRLQQMREESPTGGALGQVSEMELRLLNSAVQNLNTDQSPEQLRRNLELVRKHYQNFKEAISGSFNETGPGASGGDRSIDDILGQYGAQ